MPKTRTAKAGRQVPAPILVAGVFAVLGGCATTAPQQGDPLPGLLLQASGNQVALAWSADSPLARSFRASESVSVVASYQSPGGLVTGERIANAKVDTRQKLAVFTLPAELRNGPEGPVCLRVVRGGRQSIPLRVAAPGKTTDAFRYEAWERVATLGTNRRELESVLRETDLNLSRLGRSVEELTEWQAARGVSSADQCGSISANFAVTRPESAIAAEQRNLEARKQCVFQFGNFVSRLERDTRPGLTANVLAGEIADLLGGQPDEAQARNLKSDVSRYGMALSPDYRPRLGNDRLGITSSTWISLRFSAGQFDTSTAAAVAGAYDVCLQEARDQFSQAYEAWQVESQLPVGAQRTEVLQAECRRAFENEAKARARIAEFETARDNTQRELAALPSTTDVQLPEKLMLAAIDCNN